MSPIVTPGEESSGLCACCGRTSKSVWGHISVADQTVAIYFVHWTVGSSEHNPNFDLILGAWGEGTDPKQRILVALVYQPHCNGGSFMVIDSAHRPANDSGLCGRALNRSEVIGSPLAKEVFDLIDAIWLQDARIEDVRSLGHEA